MELLLLLEAFRNGFRGPSFRHFTAEFNGSPPPFKALTRWPYMAQHVSSLPLIRSSFFSRFSMVHRLSADFLKLAP